MIDLLISGGQSGADQGGLKIARALGIPTGGWCPQGWRTDEGAAPWLMDYGLQETITSQYGPRTVLNIRMTDALIWFGNPLSPGGRLTLREADRSQRPYILIPYPATTVNAAAIARPFCSLFSRVMVAGNRERINPGIEGFTMDILREALSG